MGGVRLRDTGADMLGLRTAPAGISPCLSITKGSAEKVRDRAFKAGSLGLGNSKENVTPRSQVVVSRERTCGE